MATASGEAQRRPIADALPWVGIVVGLWAALPPYVGPELANLESKVEIADHVVPALVMLALSAVCLIRARSGRQDGSLPLVAGMTVALAGLWMTATHLPLVQQALRGEAGVTKAVAAWHTTPGVVVVVLGLIWAAATWSIAAPEPAPAATAGNSAEAGQPGAGGGGDRTGADTTARSGKARRR